MPLRAPGSLRIAGFGQVASYIGEVVEAAKAAAAFSKLGNLIRLESWTIPGSKFKFAILGWAPLDQNEPPLNPRFSGIGSPLPGTYDLVKPNISCGGIRFLRVTLNHFSQVPPPIGVQFSV